MKLLIASLSDLNCGPFYGWLPFCLMSPLELEMSPSPISSFDSCFDCGLFICDSIYNFSL